MSPSAPPIQAVTARAYTVPTDAPEADGTFAWQDTTLVVVEVKAGDVTGLGYTYGAAAGARIVGDALAPLIEGEDPFAIPRHSARMAAQVRNIGYAGIAATAISAVDVALWDLKARLFGLPLADLLGVRRDAVAIYGSGGFTTYDTGRLRDQLCSWVEDLGCRWVKMKIGARLDDDPDRVEAAAAVVGEAKLMVDANGAYDRKQALAQARRLASLGVVWFEEPVSSDDLDGLRLLRDRVPPEIEVTAGEYAYDSVYVLRMLAAGAVDVMQLDATRIGGITGFLRATEIAKAHNVPISAHTAPALHLAVCCAAPGVRHIEWFHDHVRIEAMLFEGAPQPSRGDIIPDRTRPGLGLDFKHNDAERYSV
jgi:L-alanine-DL-glutamate epimerase-like enolase superfamily enzyme